MKCNDSFDANVLMNVSSHKSYFNVYNVKNFFQNLNDLIAMSKGNLMKLKWNANKNQSENKRV